jgi:hypothetical protein
MARQQKTRPGTSENGSGGDTATYEQEIAEYLQERIKPGLNRGSIPLLARSIAKELARRQRPDDAAETGEDDETRAEAGEESDDEPRGKARGGERDGEVDDESEAEADEDVEDEPEAEEDEDFEDEPEAEEDEDFEDEPEAEEDDELEDEPEAEEDDEEIEDEAEEDDEAEGAEAGEVSAFEDEMHQLQEDLGDEWIVRFSVKGDEAWLTAEKEDGSQHVEAPTADVLREAVELLDEGGGRSE